MFTLALKEAVKKQKKKEVTPCAKPYRYEIWNWKMKMIKVTKKIYSDDMVAQDQEI